MAGGEGTPSWPPGPQSQVHSYSFQSPPAHRSQLCCAPHLRSTETLSSVFLPGCSSACLSPASVHTVSSIQNLPVQQHMWFVVEEPRAVEGSLPLLAPPPPRACPPLHSGLACGSVTVLGAGYASMRRISLQLWTLGCNAREPARRSSLAETHTFKL